MKSSEGRLSDAVDGMREEIVELLSDLVKAKTVNPPGDTREASSHLVERFREFGVEPEVACVDEDKPNLIAEINPGGRPRLLFNSHIDTVPPGDLANWRRDPFAAAVEEGRMYGRGVADAKASVAAMTMAARALKECGVGLRGSLLVNLVSDEETGGIKGTKFLVDGGYLEPDLVVVGEQTDNRIATVEKGIIWFHLRTLGRTAHASTPWEGVNAVEKMVKLLAAIQKEVGSRLKGMSHSMTPPPSLSVGTIQGGVKTNVVPDMCEATIDRRLLPEETAEAAEGQITQIIDRLRRSDPELRAELKVLLSGSPINTSPEERIVKVAQGVAEDLGLPSELVGYRQASDGRFFAERGIPTIIVGPSDPRVGHAPDENVLLEDVFTAAKIYALTAVRTLS